jgi:uroporphyrinogen III methyltransferase/synthase
VAQDALSMLIADKAREGRKVARLKWGDPFVFDSGAKEAVFLHEQGVPFEVVPGLPAAIAATVAPTA